MKKALCSLFLAAIIASHAAADNYWVDVVESENVPWALKYQTVPVQVNVWDKNDSLNWSRRTIGVQFGQSRPAASKHFLRGSPTWHAAIRAGSKRVYGYDAKWYLISWRHVSSHYNPGIAIATSLHPRFTWKRDPSY